MQFSNKTIYVFFFGSLMLLALLFVSAGQIYSENLELRKEHVDLNSSSSNDVLHDEEDRKNYELQYFQVEMMQRKYPHFARVVEAVFKKSREHKIDAKLLMSIIETESSFNPYAVSSAGAYGLMQVNYSVWKDVYRIDHQRIFDIDYNLEIGIQILQHYLEVAGQDLHLALHYYNNGFNLENYGYASKVTSTVFY